MAHVSLKNLTKRFGSVTAVKGLDLEIQDGEFFVLLGPTGAGKTTALRCIAGLEKPDGGSIHIDRQSVDGWGPAERDVALVFQYYSLYPHYTVRQNLEFPLKSKIRNLNAGEINRRVNKAAGTLQIDHLLDRKTDKLSGGEMQRVAIGRAIVRDPRIFLMDEPLSNLDAKLREMLRPELKGLQMNLGATFLYVTHDQVEAMTMGERIGVLRRGQLLQTGTPYEVYNKPANRYVAKFVGTPTMNMLTANISDTHLIMSKEQFELELNSETKKRLDGFAGEVEAGFRSEDIVLPSENGVEARIYGIENMGMGKIITLKVGDHLLKATVDARLSVDLDTMVKFDINQEKLHFFNKDTGENLMSG
ncbi:ABC transporter ATP-binding protein [Thermodesulfobacteriota bacterium]